MFDAIEGDWINLELGQRQDGGKYFQYVKMNRNTIYKVENTAPRHFDNLKLSLGVGRSDSFDQIRHFSYMDSTQLSRCNQHCKQI